MKINSELWVTGAKMPMFTEEQIKNEPMLFNCDMGNAWRKGGIITRTFLNMLPLDWHECPVVIDTRVHMLMPGWYPAIPGWHHDDVPRTRPDGQPNYGPGQDRSAHAMAMVNDSICSTEFAIGCEDFPEVPVGERVYRTWHNLVEQYVKERRLQAKTLPPGTLVMIDDRTWHRATPATEKGWRWFGRCSRYFGPDQGEIDRKNPRTNEVRRQVQVYVVSDNQGW